MLYDAALRQVVVQTANGASPRQQMWAWSGRHWRELDVSTWEWDGAAWRQVATQGPGGRAHTAMVYDSTRKRIVLFGGLGERYGGLMDTWTWNGTAWSRISESGPPARSHHHMAFDGRAGTVVLFGGVGRGKPTAALGDTCVLEGAYG